MANLRAIIVDAVLYPAVVLVLSLIIMGFVLGYVVPKYGEFYEDLGLTLPWVTRFVLAVCQRPGACLVAPILAVLGTLLVTRAALAGTEKGRCYWTSAVYALPIIGTLVRAARLVAFTDLLAILVDHGLPLPQALQLAGEASSDPFLASGARQAQQDIATGQPLGPALRRHLMLPELIAWMTFVGEQRGDLGAMLRQIGALYRRQAEQRAALLRNVLPPFLIVVTAGVVVAAFIFALILPLVRMLQMLSD
jgi:type II secretory pathway component PulF